jgi:hypothetical protein
MDFPGSWTVTYDRNIKLQGDAGFAVKHFVRNDLMYNFNRFVAVQAA